MVPREHCQRWLWPENLILARLCLCAGWMQGCLRVPGSAGLCHLCSVEEVSSVLTERSRNSEPQIKVMVLLSEDQLT